ncbi:MAG: hypothetical protein HYV47_02590 [Candidatus Nealsonbacteria bacterium]|nr:hypothetical protein [Candidatus Nealsonbacteria bacterium]
MEEKKTLEKTCREVADRVIAEKIREKGWKGVPAVVIDEFENILRGIFSKYLFWCYVSDALSEKEGVIRGHIAGLEVDFEILPVAGRIARERERSQHEKWGIESCLFVILGANQGYFIQQVTRSQSQPEEIHKQAKEYVDSVVGLKNIK